MVDASSRYIKKRLEREGWKLIRTKGSHHIYRHPDKKELIVLPHPKKDLGKGLLKAIYRQAGWRYE